MKRYRIIEHAGGVYIQKQIRFLWWSWWCYLKVHYLNETRPTRKDFGSIADARKQIDAWLAADEAWVAPPRITEYPTQAG